VRQQSAPRYTRAVGTLLGRALVHIQKQDHEIHFNNCRSMRSKLQKKEEKKKKVCKEEVWVKKERRKKKKEGIKE
jgi:hypothetical protein